MTSGDNRGENPQNENVQNEKRRDEIGQHEDRRGEDRPAASSRPAGPSPGDRDPAPADAPPSRESEEEVLRRLLHDTVQALEPSSGSLEHLRRAVPARRTHRRQAFVGAAASLLLAVAAVPAVIHTTTASDSSSNAAHQADPRPVEQGDQGDQAAKPTPDPEKKRPDERPDEKQGRDRGSDATGGPPVRSSPYPPAQPDGTETKSAEPSACTVEQLGPGSVEVGAADGEGKVYGAFHVVNVSTADCVVDSPGTVQTAVQGAADPARVLTAAHTAGDPAAGLPDVLEEKVVLAPGQSFAVRFGWVPESGTDGCATASGTTSDAAPGEGAETGGGSAEPPVTDPVTGSVAVTYTPGGGGPSQTGTVDGVCAGTVYYTPPALAA